MLFNHLCQRFFLNDNASGFTKLFILIVRIPHLFRLSNFILDTLRGAKYWRAKGIGASIHLMSPGVVLCEAHGWLRGSMKGLNRHLRCEVKVETLVRDEIE
jgi:hypothetical protein